MTTMSHVIPHWNPEDPGFWRREGERVAQRNLWISIGALTVAFAVWMVWSALVVHLPAAGFRYSTNQLYWLAALPALSGATLRFVYAFAVPVFGGRRWTAFATASLLVPAVGIGLAVQDPETPFEWMVLLALLAGLGGANFASSMAHVSFFYPKARVGTALGLNAGLGNLGVPLAQLVVPLAVGAGALSSAGFVWVPLIVAAALAAWFGMDDLAEARGGFAEQAAIVTRSHTWLLCWLYAGSFGSFIGLAAAFPLLLGEPASHAVWSGPLLGAITRPLGGWLSDRHGGARVTLWAFVALTLGMLALMAALAQPVPAEARLGIGLVLFAAAGIGNGSTFRMTPAVFARLHEAHTGRTRTEHEGAQREAGREAAAALGFASAVGAYGGFFIPKSVGTSIALTGSPGAALAVFALFYLSCIAITWWFYGRRFAPLPC
jgi:NNP family nitrate/nitrite transporter-like MFS transporter